MSQPLDGIAVLVTRPEPAAAGLSERVRQLGGEAICQPGIALRAAADDEPSLAFLTQLAGDELIIFTSANAVRFALGHTSIAALAASAGLIAVGRKTAAALSAHGLETASVPSAGANSESLLRLPLLKEVAGRRILIACAPGGRELLQQELTARGARVDPVSVYRRDFPLADSKALEAVNAARDHLVTTVTSKIILENMTTLTESGLLGQPLCVISTRVADAARQMGYEQIHVTRAPGDQAMIEVVLKASRNLGGGAVHYTRHQDNKLNQDE